MRIWDVPPAYLNRQSLLGEHRELHGLHNIVMHGKKGYSRHPETLRWIGCLSGLARRHAALVAEMRVRGYSHRSPLDPVRQRVRWPGRFVDAPAQQYAILRSKYRDGEHGRIRLPRTPRQLWTHQKYSVLARDLELYGTVARRVARGADFASLAGALVAVLRRKPTAGALAGALERLRHDGEELMWSTLATDLAMIEGGAACLHVSS